MLIPQVSIVGDFSEEEIESCILDYLGTVRATSDSKTKHEFGPILFRPSPSDLQYQQVRIKSRLHCCYVSSDIFWEHRNLESLSSMMFKQISKFGFFLEV